MNLQQQVEQFIQALNQKYTERGVNVVAIPQQRGHNSWYVQCQFDTHNELYLIGWEDNQMQFIRIFEGVVQ